VSAMGSLIDVYHAVDLLDAGDASTWCGTARPPPSTVFSRGRGLSNDQTGFSRTDTPVMQVKSRKGTTRRWP
jgi:hypothetical protein